MIEKSQKVVTKLDPSRPAPPPAAEISPARLAPKPAASTAFIMPDTPAQQAPAARQSRVRSRAEQDIMSALSAKNTSGE